MSTRIFALAAHPDDIEFVMGGTLILLAEADCDIHTMNIANGSCGSVTEDAETIARIRTEEARNAARHLDATFHPPLVPDLEIFYEQDLLAKVTAIMRDVAPDILLLQSPQDYMEDHMNAVRLAVTAAFCRGMRNFPVNPPREAVDKPVTIYHAQPHANRGPLNQVVTPDFYVDVSTVIDKKTAMLAEHRSQKEWLDHSQGMDAYLHAMQGFARDLGELSGGLAYAEGWRRHNPLGLCGPDANPLADLLAPHCHWSSRTPQ
ncbi:MAG: PIG-L family deacetylase [Candidatus Pacebacteria bacterium]|nr:PIG-L family deacetylase [Candidatus Paceibacterota bacterium]